MYMKTALIDIIQHFFICFGSPEDSFISFCLVLVESIKAHLHLKI